MESILPFKYDSILSRHVLNLWSKPPSLKSCISKPLGLFSLYHQNPAQTIYQFCCGAAFAWVAIKSGSILPTVLSHFLNNAAIVILTKFGILEIPSPINTIIFCISAVALVVAILWLVFSKEEEKRLEKTERKTFFICAAVGILICAISWIYVLISGM